MKIAVYGLGQFGFALLKHLDENRNFDFELYGYDSSQEVIKSLREKQEHAFLYKDYRISDNVNISQAAEQALRNTDVVIVSVPSQFTRGILPYIELYAKKDLVIMNTAKALDYETGKRLSLLFREKLKKIKYRYALLAGGTIARDLFNSELLGAVIASDDENTAGQLQNLLQTTKLRIDTSTDLAGTEYASAIKNVVSIASGIVHGKGLSFGTETFIISKIAAEVENLIVTELGGRKETFSVGSQCWGNDMFMSATGKTRNREFGILLGQGLTPDKALGQMLKEKKTVEGVKTLEAINKITEINKYPLLHYLYANIIQTGNNSLPNDFQKL